MWVQVRPFLDIYIYIYIHKYKVNESISYVAMHPQGKGWFGEDGRIVALPDPVKDTPTRPRVIPNEERDAELQTVFRKVSSVCGKAILYVLYFVDINHVQGCRLH